MHCLILEINNALVNFGRDEEGDSLRGSELSQAHGSYLMSVTASQEFGVFKP